MWIAKHADPRVPRQAVEVLERLGLAALVVDDDELDRGVVGAEDAVDAAAKQLYMVLGRNDDAHRPGC